MILILRFFVGWAPAHGYSADMEHRHDAGSMLEHQTSLGWNAPVEYMRHILQ